MLLTRAVIAILLTSGVNSGERTREMPVFTRESKSALSSSVAYD